jgi:hypothetical protein
MGLWDETLELLEVSLGCMGNYRSEGSLSRLSLRVRPLPVSQSSLRDKGRSMDKRLIWVEDERFTAWCCSACSWGVVPPRLESTVAALSFNGVAQEDFQKHECNRQGEALVQSKSLL